MKVAILGFGKQGRSAYEYWHADNEITVCDIDENLELPEDVNAQLGPDHLKNLGEFDMIIRSPIVHPKEIISANSSAILEKVNTVTNEFFKVCPSRNIIGVTGTKGKGTTSTLIAKMLEVSGKTVHLGGNIGTPPLDLLKNNIQPDDFVVLELANFQLIDLKFSPNIAVCLMVVPEHLDWHADMAEYVVAKQQLFVNQTEGDIAIFNSENDLSQQVVSVSRGQKIPFMKSPGAEVVNGEFVIENQPICKINELKLLGRHNWQNACAAVTAVWQVTQNVNAIKSVLTSFSGLEHRLEFVTEVNGVRYYDDSFGTTPETAIVALKAFDEPKIVILGGSDKGATYNELALTVKNSNVRKVVLIGEQAGRIQAALEKANFNEFVNGGTSMNEIVNTAKVNAEQGDVVLLSPACASFDMFKNYADRGEQFKQAARSLK